MNYGLPYMGSKNSIVEWVISKIPKCEHFYDLFCGGCAITHGALVTNKFRFIHTNDLNPFSKLFIDAVNGKYKNDNRWISREEFNQLKDKDPYVAYVWSFGNNPQKGYLYAREIEPIKKAFHYAICFNDYSLANELKLPIKQSKFKDITNRRLDIMRHWKKYTCKNKRICEIQNFERIQNLERIQGLDNLQRLERIQGLDRLTFTNLSYDKVDIIPNSVIYCDPPYVDTAKYQDNGFNHEKFYEWCLNQKTLVIISEYYMPLDRFLIVGQREKRNTLCATSNKKAIEKLYVPINQIDLYKKLIQL